MSGAGKDIGVKHTTVARRIQTLEQVLGARLFDRLPNGYVMTHAGEKLYEHALIMEEQSLELSPEIVGLDTQLQGSLKLTAAHDVQHMGIARLPCYIADGYPTLRRLSLEIKPSTRMGTQSCRHARNG